jgi:hypothetical protein
MQDFLLELDEGDATATTKERLDGIEARLNAIEKHPGVIAPVNRTSLWARAGDHKVVAGLIVAAIVGVCGLIIGAFHSQANEYLDGRIRAQVAPVTNLLTTVDERTSRIEGELIILRAELVAQKYSAAKPKDLKGHGDELRGIKNNLAQLKPNSPGYWPAAFQLITLASQATSEVEKAAEKQENVFNDVQGTKIGAVVVANNRVVLKNLIQGVIFENSIVRFDPSVRLVNDVFINCVFIFPPNVQTPPTILQEIGKALLASDLSKVTLNAS